MSTAKRKNRVAFNGPGLLGSMSLHPQPPAGIERNSYDVVVTQSDQVINIPREHAARFAERIAQEALKKP
jgi:hypothetical protein